MSPSEPARCLAIGGVLIPPELPTSRQFAARAWDRGAGAGEVGLNAQGRGAAELRRAGAVRENIL